MLLFRVRSQVLRVGCLDLMTFAGCANIMAPLPATRSSSTAAAPGTGGGATNADEKKPTAAAAGMASLRSTESLTALPIHEFIQVVARGLDHNAFDVFTAPYVVAAMAARVKEVPLVFLARFFSASHLPLRPNDTTSIENFAKCRLHLKRCLGDLNGTELTRVFILWAGGSDVPANAGPIRVSPTLLDAPMFKKLTKLISYHINDVKDFNAIFVLLRVMARQDMPLVPPASFVALLGRRVAAMTNLQVRAPDGPIESTSHRITALQAYRAMIYLMKLEALDAGTCTSLAALISKRLREADRSRRLALLTAGSAQTTGATNTASETLATMSSAQRAALVLEAATPRYVKGILDEVQLNLSNIRRILQALNVSGSPPLRRRTLRGFSNILLPLIPKINRTQLWNDLVPLFSSSRSLDASFLRALIDRAVSDAKDARVTAQPAASSNNAIRGVPVKDIFVLTVMLGRQRLPSEASPARAEGEGAARSGADADDDGAGTDGEKNLAPHQSDPQFTLKDLNLEMFSGLVERCILSKLSVVPVATLMIVLSHMVKLGRYNEHFKAAAKRMTAIVAQRLTALAKIGVVELRRIDHALELIAIQGLQEDPFCKSLKLEYKSIVDEASASLGDQPASEGGVDTAASLMLVPTVDEAYRRRFPGSRRTFFELHRANATFEFGDTPDSAAFSRLQWLRRAVLDKVHPMRLLQVLREHESAFPGALQHGLRREAAQSLIATFERCGSAPSNFLYGALPTQGPPKLPQRRSFRVTTPSEWAAFVALVDHPDTPVTVRTNGGVWKVLARGAKDFNLLQLEQDCNRRALAFGA